MGINRSFLIICALCAAFAIAGGFGGYTLKSRLVASTLLDTQLTSSGHEKTINFTDLNIPKTADCRTQDNTLVTEFQAAYKPLPSYTNSGPVIKQLIKNIRSLSNDSTQAYNLEKLAQTEVEFLKQIDRTPELIKPLLDAYLRLPDDPDKQMLATLLAATGNLQIQEHALSQLVYGDLQNREDWLGLLGDTGVYGAQARELLFNFMSGLNRPEELSVALRAITTEPVNSHERQDVINRVSVYLGHSADTVRGAALQTLVQWGDNSHAYLIEQALSDSSVIVREAAIMATFTSNIASQSIKSDLLDLVADKNESEQLRKLAHQALNAYSLNMSEQQLFYEYHQQFTTNSTPGKAKG